MKLPWPSTIGAPSAVPPSNASPSILPTKSTVTRSPVCGARASSGVNVTLRSTQLAHRLVDGFGIDVGDEALELQALEVGELELAAAPRSVIE